MMTSRLAAAFVIVGMAAGIGGCKSAPRQRPVKMGDVDTGAGSLQDVRNQLKGKWTLASLNAIDAAGKSDPVKANGILTYDEFGNLEIQAVIDDPRLKDRLRLDYSGRIVIDTAKKEFRTAEVEAGLAANRDAVDLGRVAPDKVRRYELTGDQFTVTYLDAAGKPSAVAVWHRAGA
jgi:hypothetical protein